MPAEARVTAANLADLNPFRGLGENPTYRPTEVHPRYWPLNDWFRAPAPDDGKGFGNFAWKGVRLLKDPETQVVYHDLLWELRPATIIELGVYSGGSLLWMRDLCKSFGIDCVLHGVDRDLDRIRIPKSEMDGITLHRGDLNNPEEALAFCAGAVLKHPVLFIDDAHCNTFNVLKHGVNEFLRPGDYVVIEDTMPLWKRYSPGKLNENLTAFNGALEMDLRFALLPGQTAHSIFRVRNHSFKLTENKSKL